jgi:hypothetical protein
MYPLTTQVIPSLLIPSAARTLTGTLNFPMPDIAFVHSSGPRTSDERSLNNAGVFFTTIGAAITAIKAAGYSQGYAGAYSQVIALPGHTETITAADAWADLTAGTRILGQGIGMQRPRVTWGAAAATVLLNVANSSIHNMILDWAGPVGATDALTVAAPITASAAGCGLYDCYVTAGVDADQLCTIGLAITGNDFDLVNCRIYGATAAECTTLVNISTCDRTRIENCVIEAASSSTTVGVVRLATTAPLNILFKNSTFKNRKAASVHAVTGVAATTGTVTDCNFGVLADGTTLPWGTSNGLVDFYRCHIVNIAGETGMIPTVQST